jgi:hypothetical protein
MSQEITCEYCSHFQDSKWRVQPDPEDNGKKGTPKARLRHCQIINKYIPASTKECDSLVPHNKFWCSTNNQWMGVDACLAKKINGSDPDCYNCSQHKIILNLQRARGFIRRKLAIEAAKPVLLIRRKL